MVADVGEALLAILQDIDNGLENTLHFCLSGGICGHDEPLKKLLEELRMAGAGSAG
jgi:hypothetical protein